MTKEELLDEDKKELTSRLGRYKEIKARMEVLEIELDKKAIPRNKLVSSYGDIPGSGLGKTSPEEIEWQNKNFEIQLLNAALKSLLDLERAIISLKYIEKVSDWHIYDLYIPDKFKNREGRPLYISKRTMYHKIEQGLSKMLKCLGK